MEDIVIDPPIQKPDGSTLDRYHPISFDYSCPILGGVVNPEQSPTAMVSLIPYNSATKLADWGYALNFQIDDINGKIAGGDTDLEALLENIRTVIIRYKPQG